MEDYKAYAVVKGMALLEEILAAPKPEIDLSRDAPTKRGAEAVAKSQREEMFDAADDPEPLPTGRRL